MFRPLTLMLASLACGEPEACVVTRDEARMCFDDLPDRRTCRLSGGSPSSEDCGRDRAWEHAPLTMG